MGTFSLSVDCDMSIGDDGTVGDMLVGNSGRSGDGSSRVGDARGGGGRYEWSNVQFYGSDETDFWDCSVIVVICITHASSTMASVPPRECFGTQPSIPVIRCAHKNCSGQIRSTDYITHFCALSKDMVPTRSQTHYPSNPPHIVMRQMCTYAVLSERAGTRSDCICRSTSKVTFYTFFVGPNLGPSKKWHFERW